MIDHVHHGQSFRNVPEASDDQGPDVEGRRRSERPLRRDPRRGRHLPRRNVGGRGHHRVVQLSTPHFKVDKFSVASTTTTTTTTTSRKRKRKWSFEHQRPSDLHRKC